MAQTTHIAVRDLPSPLKRALLAAGYGRADIGVEAAIAVSPRGGGGRGRRGGLMAVNLATGEISPVHWGAWGGCNPFGANPVDDGEDLPIPPNGAIVTITQGGGQPTIAHVYVRPETLTPLLPAGPDVTARQAAILAVYVGYRSAYRREYLPGVTPDEIDGLVAGEYLKRNRAGSIRITVAGKNAAGSSSGALRQEYDRTHDVCGNPRDTVPSCDSWITPAPELGPPVE